MITYYLKFFIEPVTKEEFLAATKPDSRLWCNATLDRLREAGWIRKIGGRWVITKAGVDMYHQYLGVRR